MFSDPIPYDATPFDSQPYEGSLATLDFDGLLDIAREFEFTSTITHIWPCEESNTYHETELDDLLAAILPTSIAEEYPLPLPLLSPTPYLETDNVDVQRPVSMCLTPDESATLSQDTVPLLKDDGRVLSEAEHLTTSMLQGWSPPNGSQCLDLGDSFMVPQPTKDVWISSWSSFLAPLNTQPADGTNSTAKPAEATEPRTLPISVVVKAANQPTQNTAPFVAPPSRRAKPKFSQAGPSLPAIANVPSQSITSTDPKTTKHCVQSPCTPATGGPSIKKYAKAPRGGIPPHIARTVTRANILRVEKERKVMQNAFASTNAGRGKKPSVLRRTIKADKCGDSGKGPFESRHTDKRRAVKKVKV